MREYRIPREFFKGFAVEAGTPVAKPEKAFADCLLLPRTCPHAVLTEALPGVEVEKVVAYCSKRMTARLNKIRKLSAQSALMS